MGQLTGIILAKLGCRYQTTVANAMVGPYLALVALGGIIFD
jgi:hypothetical protein